MTGDESRPPTREERLAAKLRENLRRRKAQGRQLGAGKEAASGESPGDALPNGAEGS